MKTKSIANILIGISFLGIILLFLIGNILKKLGEEIEIVMTLLQLFFILLLYFSVYKRLKEKGEKLGGIIIRFAFLHIPVVGFVALYHITSEVNNHNQIYDLSEYSNKE